MAPRASDRKGASGVSAIDQHAYHPQTIALVTLLLGQILRADYVPEAKIDFGPDLRQLSAALSQGEEGPSREKTFRILKGLCAAIQSLLNSLPEEKDDKAALIEVLEELLGEDMSSKAKIMETGPSAKEDLRPDQTAERSNDALTHLISRRPVVPKRTKPLPKANHLFTYAPGERARDRMNKRLARKRKTTRKGPRPTKCVGVKMDG